MAFPGYYETQYNLERRITPAIWESLFLKVRHSRSGNHGKRRFIALVSVGSHCGVLADYAYIGVVVQLET